MLLRHTTPLRLIDRFKEDPVGTQRRVLLKLLQRAEHTEWGRRYDFGGIVRSSDPIGSYQERVPLATYDAFRQDIMRIRQGEKNVIWPGGFTHFAVSGGTTSGGRIIPLSREMLRRDRNFTLAAGLSYARTRKNMDFARGKILSIPGRIEKDSVNGKNVIGEVSGLLALFSPWYVRHLREAVAHDILFLPDWEAKLDRIVETTMFKDIRTIVMVPSWAGVLFRKLISAYNSRVGGNAETVSEIWPNLSVFFSGGVALSSYRSILDGLIGGGGIDYVESYGASEGFFSFQDDYRRPGMLLHLDNGVFLEFVRHGDIGSPPERLTIGQVRTGVRYELIVSSCSGLWSYRVGDLVKFTDTDPYRLVVAGRTNEMMDTYGEAVFGDEAREALAHACRNTGARIREYHIAPVIASELSGPGHEWLIEFESAPQRLDVFSEEIDNYLQRVNRHYVIRREAKAFSIPLITPLPEGSFYDWLVRTRVSVGAQTKVPRMSDDRCVADDILAVCGKNR